MRKFLTVLISALLVQQAALGGTIITTEKATVGIGNPITGLEDFDLSEKEVGCLKEAAFKGDANAAYRLGMYYEFVKQNPENSEAYFRQAVVLGNVSAKVYLGSKLLAGGDEGRREEGMLLLEQAAESGDANARKILDYEHSHR